MKNGRSRNTATARCLPALLTDGRAYTRKPILHFCHTRAARRVLIHAGRYNARPHCHVINVMSTHDVKHQTQYAPRTKASTPVKYSENRAPAKATMKPTFERNVPG